MKRFFDKTNFIPSEFDKNATRQNRFLTCLLVLFFLASSFTFFNALYGFVDAIGSIVSASADVAIYDLLRSMPLILSALFFTGAVILCSIGILGEYLARTYTEVVNRPKYIIAKTNTNVTYFTSEGE